MPATTPKSLLADLNDASHHLSIPLKTYLPEQLARLRLHATHLLRNCCTEQCHVELRAMVDCAYANLSSSSTSIPRHAWMRLYSDASILTSLHNLSPSNAKHSIAVLDRCIIVSGPAGGRLELILALIQSIQAEYLTVTPCRSSPLGCGDEAVILPLAAQEITTFSCPPSIFSFQSKYYDRPFLLRAYASDWPALNAHPWSSRAYLLSVSGPGRVVPVEIGNDYRKDTWKQSFVDWEDFLALLESPQQSSPSEVRYLAQYNLFMQFPALMDDIIVPDYVYTSISPSDLPGYAPPRNDEQLVINVWLGPKATFTPPHTDPHCNMYVQVVGRKTVWLAPPETTQWMYSYGQASNVFRDSVEEMGNSLLENTSRVDVFSDSEDSRQHYPDFWSRVVPHAMAVTLEPGDLLYIPAGWWHSMRSEQVSFSVSMWF